MPVSFFFDTLFEEGDKKRLGKALLEHPETKTCYDLYVLFVTKKILKWKGIGDWTWCRMARGFDMFPIHWYTLMPDFMVEGEGVPTHEEIMKRIKDAVVAKKKAVGKQKK